MHANASQHVMYGLKCHYSQESWIARQIYLIHSLYVHKDALAYEYKPPEAGRDCMPGGLCTI